MPLLPFANCGTPDPPDPTCAWLAVTGQEILGAALNGLAPFIPPSSGPCADTFETYLSMGPPNAEWGYDALSVHLVSVAPTPDSVALRARGGDCPPKLFPRQVATWQVVLLENCWPAARKVGEEILVPAPETLEASALWTYAHGIGMYEAVVVAAVNSTWSMPGQITLVNVGPLTPKPPQGLAVGWEFQVQTFIGRAPVETGS